MLSGNGSVNRYDGAGLLTSITYPSGRRVEYACNAIGEVEAVYTEVGSVGKVLASQIVRAPFGPVTSLVHGNGLQETRTLDQSYRVTAINVPGVLRSPVRVRRSTCASQGSIWTPRRGCTTTGTGTTTRRSGGTSPAIRSGCTTPMKRYGERLEEVING